MERADRPLRIFLQVVEERRLEAVLHALEDREVQFQRLLDRIEDAAHDIRCRIAGDLLDLPVGQQIEIELRPDALEHVRQPQARMRRHFHRPSERHQRAQHRRIVARAEGKPSWMTTAARSGLSMRRAERVLEAADEDRFVDELVVRPAQPAPFRSRAGQRAAGAPVTIRTSK